MRSIATICAVVLLAALSNGATNEWEEAGDNAPPERAIKLYAKALMQDGQSVMTLGTDVEREPYLAAMERCLGKLPWGYADPAEYKRLMRRLSPVLRREFRTPDRRQLRKRLLTKYRLLRNAGEADVVSEIAGYLVPEITVPVVVVSRMEIPTIDVQGMEIVVVDADATEIPTGAIAVVRVDESVGQAVGEWSAVYELAFRIMGEAGLYVPHRNSPLGYRHRELLVSLSAYGPEWRNDPALVAEWEAYWRAVRGGLDRRERMKGSRRNGR